MNDESKISGIISFDFQNLFPHIFWISNWSSDETYPDGVCYKVLSVRNEHLKTGEVVLVRAFLDGTKEILHRATVPLTELRNAAYHFADGLTHKLNLDFEEQDCQMATTLNDFHTLTNKYGWRMRSTRQIEDEI